MFLLINLFKKLCEENNEKKSISDWHESMWLIFVYKRYNVMINVMIWNLQSWNNDYLIIYNVIDLFTIERICFLTYVLFHLVSL